MYMIFIITFIKSSKSIVCSNYCPQATVILQSEEWMGSVQKYNVLRMEIENPIGIIDGNFSLAFYITIALAAHHKNRSRIIAFMCTDFLTINSMSE